MGIYGGIQLPKIDEQSMDSKKERKQILNYLALLDEKLRYMFQNIDIEENLSEDSRKYLFEQGEAILNVVKDTEGNFSAFRQEVDDILLQVENVDGRMSALQLTAGGLASRVSAAETGISEVAQTAAGIGTRVTSLEGSVSTVEQTANSIKTTVSNLSSDLDDLADDVDSAYSMAEQAADHFSWIVKSGNSASKMTLTDDFLNIVAEDIELTGYVTFNDLEKEGKTEINGANITTGKVSADYIGLYGWMKVRKKFDGSDYTGTGGYIGYSTGDDGVNATTEGIAVSSSDGDHYLLATNSGIRMTAEANAIVVMDNQITATVDIRVGSDRNIKNSIDYDMEKYEAMFAELKPCGYKYNSQPDGGIQLGFIAQDVEAIAADGFGGVSKGEVYSLGYNNFIALNTHMIQKLMARVTELENKLEALS